MNEAAIVGCILGTTVGDALGLPYEGVSRLRASRMLGSPSRHRFVFGHGMISDDTEHTCMVVQSLIEARDDVDQFSRRFARRIKWWLLALPAGVGKATARSGLKLWLGASPRKSGVFSAGNGPAMRAAIFGAVFDDTEQLLRFVSASSRITHTDPKAEYGAIAVALAARESRTTITIDPQRYLDLLVETIGDDGAELIALIQQAIKSVSLGNTTMEFASSLGLERGVTGYSYHTVPVAIHAWLSHPRDYASAVTNVIQCGGDADTTAAIVGGIVGAGVGRGGIPSEWIDGIWEWPRTVRWMEMIGTQLADTSKIARTQTATGVNPFAVLIRNLLFLSIVLFHGFRRLAPPY